MNAPQNDEPDLPLDSNFVEQAEYIPQDAFLMLNATHPEEESIIRRLSSGGAKLLVGPRGCGKTTLMLKAYYDLLSDKKSPALPVYVNYKSSLRLEPLYLRTPNATYWFRIWLSLKVYEGLNESLVGSPHLQFAPGYPDIVQIRQALSIIESGQSELPESLAAFEIEALTEAINKTLQVNNKFRCVLLLDDAAHAFSPKQQEDFFEFFRKIKSREISPKAAVYPGITSHSPTFHVGHDAEQIDVWVRPEGDGYVQFMTELATNRFGGNLPRTLAKTQSVTEFLAFTSFGIPRSFLNMLRSIYHEENRIAPNSVIDRRRILDIAKEGRELAHNIYDSLTHKLPSYKYFVESGQNIYQTILLSIKEFNRDKPETNQALEFGVKRPVFPELEKVFEFFQYAGLIMPTGTNSRGIKGTFDLYMIHFGDLVTENAIVGRRTKSISSFVEAFTAQTHQAWPRLPAERLLDGTTVEGFRLSLPHCQSCGAQRLSENARFCHNCGAQLKDASLYDELTKQDIAVLPISRKMVARIKSESTIRTIRDLLIDSDKTNLRGTRYIGPIRAERIYEYAKEYVA
jgi:hypothetical protein